MTPEKLKRLEDVERHLNLYWDDDDERITDYFPNDLVWLMSELKAAWEREKIMEEILDWHIIENTPSNDHEKYVARKFIEALTEVRKMRGESK